MQEIKLGMILEILTYSSQSFSFMMVNNAPINIGD
jgi:hypothetical protein